MITVICGTVSDCKSAEGTVSNQSGWFLVLDTLLYKETRIFYCNVLHVPIVLCLVEATIIPIIFRI